MPEASDPQPPPRPDPADMHWGIAYLREDIQDLRNDMRHQFEVVHKRIDQSHQLLDTRIDETNKRLDARIDETNRVLGERIDQTNQRMDDRFDETNRSLGERIDETNKRLDNRFIWLVTTMVTMTGLIIAVIKL
ncbi:MAG: hypothetical protein GKR89_30550 [Candidatus Latescibacteria bacterium]|nr:hypothetical protein [Candidatus Latescibacterota bacterium]